MATLPPRMNDWEDTRPPVKRWGHLPDVTQEFPAIPQPRLEALVSRGLVRSRGWDEIAVDDVEALLAADVESMLTGRMDYSDLARLHGIKRGWLDSLIHAGTVPQPDADGRYDVHAVLNALGKNPNQDTGRAHPNSTLFSVWRTRK